MEFLSALAAENADDVDAGGYARRKVLTKTVVAMGQVHHRAEDCVVLILNQFSSSQNDKGKKN